MPPPVAEIEKIEALLVRIADNRPSCTFVDWSCAELEDVHVERLGYSTVGHYFYGLARGMNAEQTMRAVADDAVSKSLPFSWWLLDSWWYGENSTPLPTTFGGSNDSVPGYGGTWRWDDTIARTRAGGFPSGLRNLTDYLGGPLVMHFGEWVGNSSTCVENLQ